MKLDLVMRKLATSDCGRGAASKYVGL